MIFRFSRLFLTFLLLFAGCSQSGKGADPEKPPGAGGQECACLKGQSCVQGACEGLGMISVEELKKALPHKDFLLINVRVPVVGTIPGTDTVIADDRMCELADFIGADKNRKTILYCRTIPRARQAAQALMDRGYRNIGVVEGGIMAWKATSP